MSQDLSVNRVGKDNLPEVWASCSEIARNMAYPSFFCSGDWLKASAENICSDDELLILLARHGGHVKAVLPLVSRRNALCGRDLHFLGTDFYPDPLGLICMSSERAVYAKALQDYLFQIPGWDRFIFDWVLEDEPADWNLSCVPISVEPFKVLPQSFSALLGEFKQKKRYNLHAMVRKFFDAGGELLISVDSTTHDLFLEELFSLHSKRAFEKVLDSSFSSFSSTFNGTRVRALHKTLVTESDSVRFYALRLNNQWVAVIYGFEFCNRFFYYQVAHDPAFRYLSPGSVLLYLVIENCCERGITEFNFLQGDESYKSLWTKDSRVLYRCILKRNTWRSRVFDELENTRGFFKRALRLINHGN